MGDWDRIRRLAGLTLIVGAIVAVASVLINRLGFEVQISLMASIITILASSIAIADRLYQSDEEVSDSDADRKTAARERSTRQRISSTGETGGARSKEEYIEMIKNDPEWRSGGKRNFSNRTVAAGRFVQHLLNRLGISKRNRIWAHRITMGVATLASLDRDAAGSKTARVAVR